MQDKASFDFHTLGTRQRHLPHWSAHDATYWVTFRLADSVPSHKIAHWKNEWLAWLAEHPKPWDAETVAEYEKLYGESFEDILDEGHGSCALSRPDVREAVRSCLMHFDGERHDIAAAVIMPTHVHCLIKPHKGWELRKVIASVKSFSGRAANRMLGKSGIFWKQESYDHIVRGTEEFERYVKYVENNPVKAKLKEGEYWLYVR